MIARAAVFKGNLGAGDISESTPEDGQTALCQKTEIDGALHHCAEQCLLVSCNVSADSTPARRHLGLGNLVDHGVGVAAQRDLPLGGESPAEGER